MRLSTGLRSLVAISVLSALLALPATAGIGRFTPFGPPGEALGVQALLTDPLTPGTVYAMAGADLYRSTDGGGSWTLLGPYPFVRMAAARTGPNPVLYGGSVAVGQVSRSFDSGRTWSPILTLPVYVGGTAFLHLEVSPALPTRVYVAAQSDVFRSDDGGDSWTRVFTGESGITGFVVDPRDADRVTLLNGDRVIASTDGGRSWSAGVQPLFFGFTIYPSLLASAPSRPEVLYVSGLDAVCRSEDAGASFLCRYAPFYATDLLVDPADDSTLYAADPRGGVAVSDDGGGSWQRLRENLPRPLYRVPIGVLASDPANGGLFVGTSDRAAQRIAGRAWQTSSAAGFLTGYASLLQFRPGRPAEIYLQLNAVTSDGGGYGILDRSRDGGRTWQRLGPAFGAGGIAVRGLVFDPSEPSSLYACSAGSLLKSADDGATWGTLSINAVWTLVNAGRRTLLAGGCGIQRSVDGGAKWREALTCVAHSDPIQGDTIRQVSQLANDPASPALVYAVTYEGVDSENPHDPSPQTPYLYRSQDGGVTWRHLPASPVRIAVAPGRPQTLYAVQADGIVLRSDNSGGSFRPAGILNAQITSLSVDPHDPDILYASLLAYPSLPGVVRSVDGGATWQAANAGLPRLGRFDVQAVVADPVVANRIYALPTLGGLFVADLPNAP